MYLQILKLGRLMGRRFRKRSFEETLRDDVRRSGLSWDRIVARGLGPAFILDAEMECGKRAPEALLEKLGFARPRELEPPRPRLHVWMNFQVGLETRAKVNLLVYDCSGRLVRNLANACLDPGVYSIGWDGNDDLGNPVAPGSYVAKLHADDRTIAHDLEYGLSQKAQEELMMRYLTGGFPDSAKPYLIALQHGTRYDAALNDGERPSIAPQFQLMLDARGAPVLE